MMALTGKSGLPESDRVDPTPLARTFRAVNTSYKHLFFRVLLREGIKRGKQQIEFANLATGMMEEAWWPGFHYRLQFGLQDEVVARIRAAVDQEVLRRDPGMVRRALKSAVATSRRDPLLRHVPQRFIRPWFASETLRLPDQQVDRKVEMLSQSRFNEIKPIYRLLDTGIEFHPAWTEYLERNLAIVQGWSDAHWLRFLERRNPAVPGLVQKIAPALRRPPLGDQRALWLAIIETHGVESIYSGNMIDKTDFDLDHFLPRAFCAHDRFWNLTPIESGLNAEKSDLLPDLDYVPGLARQHSLMARHAETLHGRAGKAWRRALDEYATDFRLEPARLQNAVELERIYSEWFPGQAGIAKRMGFPDGWRPNSVSTRP